MKQLFTAAAIAIVGLACGASIGTSCTATKTTREALFPAATLAWPAVEEDYSRGILDGTQDGDLSRQTADMLKAEGVSLGKALAARDELQVMRSPWTATMAPWALRGIDDQVTDGEIGLGVAESLREQVKNFTDVIERLQETQ